MQQPKLIDRIRYAFDNSMTRGPIALLGWLTVISIVVIVIIALIVSAAGAMPEGVGPMGDNTQPDFIQTVWMGLMRTLDAGTMGGDKGPWPFLIGMLAFTVVGVVVVSALIGIINNGIEDKLDQLRKGRSFVLEQQHTLILGWSPKIFTILSELVIANANQPKPRIVILADKDKVEMEDEIRDRVGSTGKTKIICRTGNPLELGDLEIVNPHTARSIIILSPESGDPDSEVIKMILAITNNPNRRTAPYHIVAELSDSKNLDVARMVGRNEAELIVSRDLISRIVVQTARQSGLSVVYTELLDFGGDEIYFQEETKLVGRTFGEALLAYEDSAVIGLRPQASGTQLNPPMDTVIQAGDKVIAISEDDDTVRVSEIDWRSKILVQAIQAAAPVSPQPERTLILGWNGRGPMIINELDNYVAPGSQLTVVADLDGAQAEIERECSGLRSQAVTCQQADTTNRRVLDGLKADTYDQIIILCYSDMLDQQEADARTLITLLHLRDIAEKTGGNFRVVSEMLDVRNRELAEVTRADDFIVSNKLVSLMLSQVSENKELNAVFADIFDPEGSEIYLKPAGNYVALGQPINFYTVVEAARRRGEVAIGYRRDAEAEDAAKAHGVVVNPDKSNSITFEKDDRIIVLAEQ